MAGESDEDYERKAENTERMLHPERFINPSLNAFSTEELLNEVRLRRKQEAQAKKNEAERKRKERSKRYKTYLELKKEFES